MEAIHEQLEQVRDEGSTNMLDIYGVQAVASRLELYELVNYCQDLIELPEHERSQKWADLLMG